MTFSILVKDPETGALGGAAATGSYCVGGWVLRGTLDGGMSASQGASPSTFWGEDTLKLMAGGANAQWAVDRVTNADTGRAFRQLAALDVAGNTGIYSGAQNTPAIDSKTFPNGIAAGNMLSTKGVIKKMVQGYESATGTFGERLLASLRSAEKAGSDRRGLFSAALLILHPDHAPLTLRIDYHPNDPIGALAELFEKTRTGEYAQWSRQVPTQNEPERVLD